jgi:hypothetical protein
MVLRNQLVYFSQQLSIPPRSLLFRLNMQFTRLLIALSTVLGITSVLGLPLATEETSLLATRNADAMIYGKRGNDGM